MGIGTWLALVTTALAIAGFLISYGVWKGRTDAKLEELVKKFDRHDSEHRELRGSVADTRERLASVTSEEEIRR